MENNRFMDMNDDMESNNNDIFLYTHDTFPENTQVCELFPMVYVIGKVRLTDNHNRIEVDEIINDFKAQARTCSGVNAIVGVKMSIGTLKDDTASYLIVSCAGNPAVIGAVVKDDYFY